MKEASALRDREGMSTDELRNLLLNTGVIGSKVNTSPIQGKDIYILNGIFEYQVKSILTLTSRSVCIVHPMFVQELKIKDADQKAFVYPLPAESEEQEALKRSGVNLV
jgi:hypothetical protein